MSNKFKVHRIINEPIASNCYVVYDKVNSSAVIIDPGTLHCEKLLSFLNDTQLTPQYIILTHEHFDHIWGISMLKKKFDTEIICSAACGERITDRKKNMSLFYDQVGFGSCSADILLEEVNYQVEWNGIKFHCIQTEGHSSGSICIIAGDMLFSGDTIIPGVKTITKFPNSSRNMLKISIEKISNSIKYPTVIMPGHGEQFFVQSRKDLLELDI